MSFLFRIETNQADMEAESRRKQYNIVVLLRISVKKSITQPLVGRHMQYSDETFFILYFS